MPETALAPVASQWSAGRGRRLVRLWGLQPWAGKVFQAGRWCWLCSLLTGPVPLPSRTAGSPSWWAWWWLHCCCCWWSSPRSWVSGKPERESGKVSSCHGPDPASQYGATYRAAREPGAQDSRGSFTQEHLRPAGCRGSPPSAKAVGPGHSAGRPLLFGGQCTQRQLNSAPTVPKTRWPSIHLWSYVLPSLWVRISKTIYVKRDVWPSS